MVILPLFTDLDESGPERCICNQWHAPTTPTNTYQEKTRFEYKTSFISSWRAFAVGQDAKPLEKRLAQRVESWGTRHFSPSFAATCLATALPSLLTGILATSLLVFSLSSAFLAECIPGQVPSWPLESPTEHHQPRSMGYAYCFQGLNNQEG